MLFGCSTLKPHATPSGVRGLFWTTERVQYSPGAQISTQLDNRRARPVLYNFCGSTLQVQTAQGWRDALDPAVHPPPDCTQALVQLDRWSSKTGVYLHHLTVDLSDGHYRLTHTVEVAGQARQVVTNIFLVRGSGEVSDAN